MTPDSANVTQVLLNLQEVDVLWLGLFVIMSFGFIFVYIFRKGLLYALASSSCWLGAYFYSVNNSEVPDGVKVVFVVMTAICAIGGSINYIILKKQRTVIF